MQINGTSLANLPLFASLETADLERISRSVTRTDVPARTVLFRRGDPCVGFHVVDLGQVKLSVRAANGDEKVIEIVGAGQSFGEALMFLEKPYLVEAETLARSTLLFVPRETIFAAMDADARVARRMIGALSARLHGLVMDLEAYALKSARQRVVGYLLANLPEGAATGEHAVRLVTRKGVIASRLNLTQESFSRILGDLSSEGLIEVRGRDIAIADVGRLRAAEE